ncbi:MAG: FkbM family methyltransferase [Patescibacteria group bacterium]
METSVFRVGKNNLKINIRDEADQSVFNEIFRLGEYRSAEDAIKTAKNCIIDAGAHVGFFSLYCRALNSSVKIFAIEPEAKNLSALKNHIKNNKIKKIKIFKGVLAGETGKRHLEISDDSHNHSITYSESEKKIVLVESVSFSDFCKFNKIKIVDLFKIDVEGAEYEIFENIKESDLSIVKFIILEYHNGNKRKMIERKLRQNGFGVQIFPSKFDKTMGFLWAKNKRWNNLF